MKFNYKEGKKKMIKTKFYKRAVIAQVFNDAARAWIRLKRAESLPAVDRALGGKDFNGVPLISASVLELARRIPNNTEVLFFASGFYASEGGKVKLVAVNTAEKVHVKLCGGFEEFRE